MNFKEQARASIEQLDAETEAAAETRVGAILSSKPLPEPQKAIRKRRSDAGVPKKPPSGADEIVLHVTVDVARSMANALTETFPSMSALLQDQIIAQLQKRLDVLQKQK